MFLFVTFLGISLWQVFYRRPDSWWANWWFFNLIFAAVTGVIATVWFLIGGFRDLHALFRRLSETQLDESDDGTVKKAEHLGD